jgi:uroporphyrin-3 C-methyltransferase
MAVVLALLAGVSLALAWTTQQRVKALERDLVRRQQESQAQATEARVLAKQAQDGARDAVAKAALLEARVAESTVQRTQLEELIQSMSRSRDENLLADVDAALRVAVQQSVLTGSSDPLMTVLRQAEERLARANQPRLERVRRAVAQDIDRVKTMGQVDVVTLTIKLDEAVRLVDELPLLAQPERKAVPATAPHAVASGPAGAASAPVAALLDLRARWDALVQSVWRETQALVRVTRIDQPEAMLVAPEQAWFLRENLKLRLLNARLALLSRQFATAQSDLRDSQSALDRYFDRGARRVQSATDLVRQVAAQARAINLPRPDDTFAAIAAAQAGR